MKPILSILRVPLVLAFMVPMAALHFATPHAPAVARQLRRQQTAMTGLIFAANPAINGLTASKGATSTVFTSSIYFKQVDIIALWSGVTGSPAGCTIQVEASGDGTAFAASGSPISVTPGTDGAWLFTGAFGIDTMYDYSCTTYPKTGTLTLENVYK
jgi:hypothetical protein